MNKNFILPILWISMNLPYLNKRFYFRRMLRKLFENCEIKFTKSLSYIVFNYTTGLN